MKRANAGAYNNTSNRQPSSSDAAPILLTIHVKLRAQHPSVTELEDGSLEVAVKEPPIDGRANAAVVRAVAELFRVAPSRVTIRSGHASRTKAVEVN